MFCFITSVGLAWRVPSSHSPTGRRWDGLSMREGPAVPPIEVLAARQHAASLLAANWETVSERLGDVFSGRCVAIAPSSLHGVGLVAQKDLEAGEFIAFFPIHRILQTLDGGQVVGTLVDEADEEYFCPRSPPPDLTADALAYRQVAYRQTYSNVNPDKPERFLLDANPTKSPTSLGGSGTGSTMALACRPAAQKRRLPDITGAAPRRAIAAQWRRAYHCWRLSPRRQFRRVRRCS